MAIQELGEHVGDAVTAARLTLYGVQRLRPMLSKLKLQPIVIDCSRADLQYLTWREEHGTITLEARLHVDLRNRTGAPRFMRGVKVLIEVPGPATWSVYPVGGETMRDRRFEQRETLTNVPIEFQSTVETRPSAESYRRLFARQDEWRAYLKTDPADGVGQCLPLWLGNKVTGVQIV